MPTNIRKVKHNGRKHFMTRACDGYAFGIDPAISGNRKEEPANGHKTGRANPGRRTKRELLNAAERADKD